MNLTIDTLWNALAENKIPASMFCGLTERYIEVGLPRGADFNRYIFGMADRLRLYADGYERRGPDNRFGVQRVGWRGVWDSVERAAKDRCDEPVLLPCGEKVLGRAGVRFFHKLARALVRAKEGFHVQTQA